MGEMKKFKDDLYPLVDKWFNRWEFEFKHSQLHFYRRDIRKSSYMITDIRFRGDDLTEDVAFKINWYNKIYPLEHPNSKRRQIMNRRKWLNRQRQYEKTTLRFR